MATVTFYPHQGAGSVFREPLAGCEFGLSGAVFFRTYFLQPRREWLAPMWKGAIEAVAVLSDRAIRPQPLSSLLPIVLSPSVARRASSSSSRWGQR